MSRDTILRILFWLAIAVSLAAALNPQPPRIPGPSSDKSQHILAFLMLDRGLRSRRYIPRVADKAGGCLRWTATRLRRDDR